MVARGDLGVRLPLEDVPHIQKQIIRTGVAYGKPVITATQMLESMTHNASPTRAEASDVANAIFDGTDVIMLSGETAIGEFPVKTVETMTRIARFAEGSDVYREAMGRFHTLHDVEGVASAAVAAACVAADQLKAKALIPFTSSGWTAFSLASRRPETPIYACTSQERTCARLALCWGTQAVLVPEARDLDDLYVVGIRTLIDAGLLAAEDVVVLLSGSVLSGTGANSIKLYRVGTLDLTDHPETRHRLQGLIDRPGTHH
jgi:pyruvate kinase